MKNLFDTIKNIWRIEELRKRILITLGLLLIYRIGSFIVLPGVDSAALASASTGGGGTCFSRRARSSSGASHATGGTPGPSCAATMPVATRMANAKAARMPT